MTCNILVSRWKLKVVTLFNLEGIHRSVVPGIELGGLAQLGERLICIQEVNGSIPLFSTTWARSSAG